MTRATTTTADKPVKATKPRAKKAEGKFKRAAFILRTCNPDMTSHNGFVWPKSGLVEAPDWKPTEACGHGLHGFLNGDGDGGLANFSPDAKWIVAEIEAGWIDLGGKVKFRRANVVHCGDRLSACEFLQTNGVKGAIVGGTATAGDCGTATAGDCGTATAGYGGTATAGNDGTATAGDDGTATAGDYGTATAGNYGTATAGNGGTATAGNYGTATAGNGGTATAGDDGTATAGDGGTILIRFYDGSRYRIATGYVGENGIKPNTPYRVKDGKVVEASK